MTIKRRVALKSNSIDQAEDGTITMQNAADLLGLTYQALKRWRDDGMPMAENGSRGVAARVHMRDIMAWREDRASAKALEGSARFHASPEEMDEEGGRSRTFNYEQERAKKTAMQAIREEVEALKSLGRVVDIDAVARLVEDEFAEIRAGLLNLPSVLAVPLSTMSDDREIAEFVRRKVTEVLERLSRPEDIGPMARDGVSRLAAEEEEEDEDA